MRRFVSCTVHRKRFGGKLKRAAPIDVFLSAAVEEVEKLQKKGMTLNGGPRIYAQTSLVLVMSANSLATPVSFRDVLPNRGIRIALGDPKTSALGEITARALTKLDPAYRSHFHLLHAEHSEDIVNLVHTGKAEVGIVYRVDAINSGQVRIIDETPAGTYTPVQFGKPLYGPVGRRPLVLRKIYRFHGKSPHTKAPPQVWI